MLSGKPSPRTIALETTRLTARELLRVTASGIGYERYQRARRLAVSTGRLQVLLPRFRNEGRIKPRKDRDGTGNSRTRYYLSGSPDAASRASGVSARSKSHNRLSPDDRPRELTVRLMLGAIRPGIGYAAAQLARYFGTAAQCVNRLMPPGIGNGRIVQCDIDHSPAVRRRLYYVAGSKPGAGRSSHPAPPPAAVAVNSEITPERPVFDAEYGRTLTTLRDLCEAVRGEMHEYGDARTA
jgi:hypothetical protein